MVHRFAYFPGCAAQSSAREVNDAVLALAPVLDIELIPMDGAACCGAGVIRQANEELQLSLNARTFAMAEQQGLDVLTPCATCQGNMWEDLDTLLKDDELRERINEVLERTTGMRFKGELRMRHLLHVLVEDIGLETIKSRVVNSLDFPIAGYYGAPMLQSGANGDDDPWNPVYLEQLLDVLGAETVTYDGRTRSVGFPSILSQEKTVLKMTAEVIKEAKTHGARVMASACPLSHLNLDGYQVKAGRATNTDTDMPVVHLPELVAFALGLYPDRLAYLRTRVMVIGT